MSWRFAFIKHCGPGGLAGCTMTDWCKILVRNRFVVDPRYWPRASFITLNSFANSLWRLWEHSRYAAKIKQTLVPPPLFVLGIWRSGTTHLHNLLAKDDRFAFPNTYQVLNPQTFLSTETWSARAMQSFMPATRPMDNVKSSIGAPQEDEFALVPCGLSFLLGTLAFPRTGAHYLRFLSLREATSKEIETWKTTLMWFLQKLTLKYDRPLVLKSPAHTSRIKLLLELFPDAKFVHIHRHPYTVFQSSLHAAKKTAPYWALQKSEPDVEWLIDAHREVYDAFFEQRDLIPAGNFCEVAFGQLEKDPIREIRRIYETLGLPSFDEVESKLSEYVQSLKGYTKNTFDELSPEMQQRLAQEWSRCFDEWQYAK